MPPLFDGDEGLSTPVVVAELTFRLARPMVAFFPCMIQSSETRELCVFQNRLIASGIVAGFLPEKNFTVLYFESSGEVKVDFAKISQLRWPLSESQAEAVMEGFFMASLGAGLRGFSFWNGHEPIFDRDNFNGEIQQALSARLVCEIHRHGEGRTSAIKIYALEHENLILRQPSTLRLGMEIQQLTVENDFFEVMNIGSAAELIKLINCSATDRKVPTFNEFGKPLRLQD